LRMILSFLQPFAGNLHFQNLNLCISCWHYVYFLILLFMYFLILLLCTFLNIGKAYARKNLKKWKNYGLVYFPKFNMCTSKTETRPCTSHFSMVVLLALVLLATWAQRQGVELRTSYRHQAYFS
jgi:hypothetical protein